METKVKFRELLVKFPNQVGKIRFDKYFKNIFKIEGKKINIKQSDLEKAIRKKFFYLNDFVLSAANANINHGDTLKISSFFFENVLLKSLVNENDLFDPFAPQKKYTPPLNLLTIVKDSIIFENENLLVLNKPSGIPVQGGTKVPHSLDKILNYIYFGSSDEIQSQDEDEFSENQIKVLHRLDKKTTGVLIFAKNGNYAKKVAEGFQLGKIEKTYELIARKVLHKKDSVLREAGDELRLEARLWETKIGSQEVVSFCLDKNQGKDACTKFRLIKYFYIKNDDGQQEKLYFFNAWPETGRKHQIRAHLAHLGFCILGDEKYESVLTFEKKIKKSKIGLSTGKIFLHAKKISIPFLNFEMEAERPAYFEKIFV